MKILITGANGFVGGHLCQRLLADGHSVYALVRNPKNFDLALHENLKLIKGDLDQESLNWTNELPSDLNACVHTAGIVHSFNSDDFYQVNTVGSIHLLNNLKAKYTDSHFHFILISSLAAAGPSLSGITRNEDDLDLPISAYGQSKKKAEERVKDLLPENFVYSVIRPPMVIGPRDKAVLDLFKMVKAKVIVLPGLNAKSKKYSFVCVFDLVETIKKTLETKKTTLFYSAYPKVVSFNEIIKAIQKELGIKKVFYLYLPLFLIKLVSTLLYIFYRIRPHSLRLTPDKYFEFAADNWTCDAKKSEDELSQVYQYDLDKTIHLTLKDYKEKKWL